MSTFDGLTPIEVDVAVNEVTNAYIAGYESATGKIMAPGDPRRIFLTVLAARFVQFMVQAQLEKRQVLIRYAPIEVLENIGAERGVTRIPATAATTTIQFNLSIPLASAQIVPTGTRVAPVDSQGDLFFSTVEPLEIPAGASSGTVRAMATLTGSAGNGFLPNQLTTIIDPLPFIASVTNTTESGGGSEIEDVEAFRERVRIAPEGYSVAGPRGAYIFWAKTASADIVDVAVSSPAASEVVVVPLLSGGQIPGAEVLAAVSEVLNDEYIRPMTDKVTIAAPSVVGYNINLSYKLPLARQTEATALQAAVNQAVEDYVAWQYSALGRDIDPTELIRRVGNAGAIQVSVTSPTYTAVDFDDVAKAGTKTVTFGGLADG